MGRQERERYDPGVKDTDSTWLVDQLQEASPFFYFSVE